MKISSPFGLYRVSGESMLPTYKPGDLLLGRRWGKPAVGDVVVVKLDRPLIKRLERFQPDGRLWLLGDNAAGSTDSRQFGAVDAHAVKAVIIAKIASFR